MRNFLIVFVLFSFSCSSEKNENKNSEDKTKEDENPLTCIYEMSITDFKDSELYKKSDRIEVRSYEIAFEGVEEAEEPMDGDTIEKVDPRENYVEKLVLNEHQKDSLFKLINGFHKDLDPIGADCYWPRHMIAFIDSNDSLIGSIDICFECGRIESNLEEFNYLCEDQLTYYMNFLKWCGLTKGFRN